MAGSPRRDCLLLDSPHHVPVVNGADHSDRHSLEMRKLIHLTTTRSESMLYTIAIVLLVLWLLGMVSAYTVGGFIHVLLVVAIIMVLVRVIQGRRPVA